MSLFNLEVKVAKAKKKSILAYLDLDLAKLRLNMRELKNTVLRLIRNGYILPSLKNTFI